MRWHYALVLLVALTLFGASLIQGRTFALLTDAPSVGSNTFATANCFPRDYYWHNNPTPPTGDTNLQATLPLNTTGPTATTLYNYDMDRDSNPGRAINKGGSGVSETDSTKYQVWRTAALSSGQCLVGTVTIDLWAAIKDFGQGKAGEVTVFLRDYNGSTYTEIGNGTVSAADWQGGSTTWVQRTISISSLNYTVPSGNMLEVKVIVGSNSGDDMWFAYDTTSYQAPVKIPKNP